MLNGVAQDGITRDIIYTLPHKALKIKPSTCNSIPVEHLFSSWVVHTTPIYQEISHSIECKQYIRHNVNDPNYCLNTKGQLTN